MRLITHNETSFHNEWLIFRALQKYNLRMKKNYFQMEMRLLIYALHVDPAETEQFSMVFIGTTLLDFQSFQI